MHLIMIGILIIIIIHLNMSHYQQYINEDESSYYFPEWERETFYIPLESVLSKNVIYLNDCKYRVNNKDLTTCCGTKCQNLSNTFNVTTSWFKVQLTSVEVIRLHDFDNLNHLQALELEANSKLRYFEPGCFRNMSNLRNMTIRSNPRLKLFDSNLFQGLINLRLLILSRNGFTRVIDIASACIPAFVPRLRLLDISEHTLEDIKEYDFHSMNDTNLKQLNIIMCQLKHIHPNCLSPFRKLISLRLCQNLFNRTTITNLITNTINMGIQLNTLNLYQIGLRKVSPYKLFEAIAKSSIYNLILSGNIFNTIDNKWFLLMPNIKCLDLRDCMIINIEDESFRNLSNLVYLRIGGNKFEEFPNAIARIKTLYTLDLSGKNGFNQNYGILNIPDGCFQNMTNLINLRLSYNNIGTINNKLFFRATMLLRLYLKNSSLYFIEDNSFSHMPNLVYLNLINNPLLSKMPLSSETFYGLNNLSVLLLGGCQLGNLTANPNMFSHLNSLTYLGLERNDLLVINPDQLTHLNYLTSLQLSDNKLPAWKKRILPRQSLKTLNANSNQFTFITTAMLEDWQHLQTLYFDNNPLVCDCSLYSVVKWLKTNEISFNRSSDFVANCLAPEMWRHRSVSEFLDYLKVNGTYSCEDRTYFTSWIIICCTLLIIIIIISILIYLLKWHIRYWIFLFRLSFVKHNPWKINNKNDSISSDMEEYIYDAFVSYSCEDRLFVLQLISELEGKEPFLKLCVYERDFQIGASISQAILKSVATSRRTVLIISNAFAKSHWCRWEMQLAEYHQLFFHDDKSNVPDDTLLIIKLEKLDKKYVTPTLKYLLKSRIYLEWNHNNSDKQMEFWSKLRLFLTLSKNHD